MWVFSIATKVRQTKPGRETSTPLVSSFRSQNFKTHFQTSRSHEFQAQAGTAQLTHKQGLSTRTILHSARERTYNKSSLCEAGRLLYSSLQLSRLTSHTSSRSTDKQALTTAPQGTLAHLRCAIPTTPSLRSFPHWEILITETGRHTKLRWLNQNFKHAKTTTKSHGYTTVLHHFAVTSCDECNHATLKASCNMKTLENGSAQIETLSALACWLAKTAKQVYLTNNNSTQLDKATVKLHREDQVVVEQQGVEFFHWPSTRLWELTFLVGTASQLTDLRNIGRSNVVS